MLTRNDETGFSGKRWPQYREEIEGFIALLNREGVTADWRNYGVMSRIVAFHDIHTRSKREGMRGPRELWLKLAFNGDYRNEMISVDPNRRGIGILFRA